MLTVRSQATDLDGGFAHRWEAIWRDGGAEGEDSQEDLNPRVLADLYDSGIAYFDSGFGRILEGLRSLDIVDDTVMVLTSDHGESLGDDGLLGHGNLSDGNLSVPLIVAYPRRAKPGVVPWLARHVDILPTVLDLAGMSVPPGVDGVPLMSEPGSREERGRPPAWSYAGWTNLGIAVRMDGLGTYRFNDSPWAGICGEESYSQASSGEGSELDQRSWDAARGRVWEYLQQKTPGLRAHLINGAESPLVVTFSGSSVLPWTLKRIGGSCPAVDWSAGDEVARVQIGRGESTLLAFQQDDLSLQVTAELKNDGSAAMSSFRIEEARRTTEPRLLINSGGGWQWSREVSLEPGDVGLVFEWVGSRGASSITFRTASWRGGWMLSATSRPRPKAAHRHSDVT